MSVRQAPSSFGNPDFEQSSVLTCWCAVGNNRWYWPTRVKKGGTFAEHLLNNRLQMRCFGATKEFVMLTKQTKRLGWPRFQPESCYPAFEFPAHCLRRADNLYPSLIPTVSKTVRPERAAVWKTAATGC